MYRPSAVFNPSRALLNPLFESSAEDCCYCSCVIDYKFAILFLALNSFIKPFESPFPYTCYYSIDLKSGLGLLFFKARKFSTESPTFFGIRFNSDLRVSLLVVEPLSFGNSGGS